MKISNNSKLPDIVTSWAKHDAYDRGSASFTTTELLKPVRILALQRKHWDEMEVDVQDLLWRLDGQAKHLIFQRIAELEPERYIAEKRYTMAIAGDTNSGQLDLYDMQEKALYDMKWTKTWKWILGDAKEWTEQANINAFLCYHIGNHLCEKLSNIVVFRDWDVRMAQRDPQRYPQHKCIEWPLEKWDFAKTLQFIQSRIRSHKTAAEEGELPLCSPSERWQKPSRFAVMKQGRARAVKLFDTRVDALTWLDQQSDSKTLQVVARPGEDTRCLLHCDVWNYCDHGKAVRAGKAPPEPPAPAAIPQMGLPDDVPF